ncbi:MAG: prepilin-type cleavage/methylation domain-containing protein, partial [Deltaproteobacteria bacterium]|nr:prepilin-type cleavage/methylation domain-containing protein [Deltaproteobacteria bacterium]
YREQARISTAIGDLRTLDNQLKSYKMSNDSWPPALNAVPQGTMLDPWGNNYRYLAIEDNVKAKGSERKDKNLVPINSDFDLYSNGKDGASSAPLTAAASQDDIVRANDGRYFGLASKY